MLFRTALYTDPNEPRPIRSLISKSDSLLLEDCRIFVDTMADIVDVAKIFSERIESSSSTFDHVAKILVLLIE